MVNQVPQATLAASHAPRRLEGPSNGDLLCMAAVFATHKDSEIRAKSMLETCRVLRMETQDSTEVIYVMLPVHECQAI